MVFTHPPVPFTANVPPLLVFKTIFGLELLVPELALLATIIAAGWATVPELRAAAEATELDRLELTELTLDELELELLLEELELLAMELELKELELEELELLEMELLELEELDKDEAEEELDELEHRLQYVSGEQYSLQHLAGVTVTNISNSIYLLQSVSACPEHWLND